MTSGVKKVPSIRRKTTKAGRDYYEITVSRGRSQSRLFSRWYVPEGWSQRAIDRELAKVAAEFERQCKAGEVVSRREKRQQEAQEAEEAAKIQTVRQYGERVFMPAKAVTMSENSRASFQSALNTWIYPAIGDKKLPDVSPADLSALLLEIQAKGKAHATAVKIYTVLHTLFKMAYLADAIPRNPMDKVSRPVPRKDEIRETEAQALTVDELRAVLEALEAEPLKWQALVHVLIDTGCRRDECCGLQWGGRGPGGPGADDPAEPLLHPGAGRICGHAKVRQGLGGRHRPGDSGAPGGPERPKQRGICIHPGEQRGADAPPKPHAISQEAVGPLRRP